MSKLFLSFNKLIKFNYTKKHIRYMSSYSLLYKSYGDPIKVIEKVDKSSILEKKLEKDENLLEFIASPINPSDINQIQGVYALKPPLPAIAGNEGVARVIKVGPESSLKVDDLVIPSHAGIGTWSNHAIVPSSKLVSIDKRLDVLFAAQLSVNPCTAYRMLKDFVQLYPGDSVMQNGANSAVGLYVIQMAREWGIKTINVIRNRSPPELESLKQKLHKLGADIILTEEDIVSKDKMNQIWSQISKPKLLLNCIGGINATNCMKHLAFGGTMVTYGGMSKQPVTIPTSILIFNDIRFFGFWITQWKEKVEKEKEREIMLNDISSLFLKKKIELPQIELFSLNNYQEAIDKAMKVYSNKKIVFKF